MAKRLGDEPVHGCRIGVPFGVQERRRVIDRHLPWEAVTPVRQRFGNRLARFELVAHVAKQLGKHVLERDQAGRAAELIDDERLMSASLPEISQDTIGRDALGYARDWPDDALQGV